MFLFRPGSVAGVSQAGPTPAPPSLGPAGGGAAPGAHPRPAAAARRAGGDVRAAGGGAGGAGPGGEAVRGGGEAVPRRSAGRICFLPDGQARLGQGQALPERSGRGWGRMPCRPIRLLPWPKRPPPTSAASRKGHTQMASPYCGSQQPAPPSGGTTHTRAHNTRTRTYARTRTHAHPRLLVLKICRRNHRMDHWSFPNFRTSE